MYFELSEEHQAVKEAARDFAQNVLKSGVIDRDRDQRFPAEEVKQQAALAERERIYQETLSKRQEAQKW